MFLRSRIIPPIPGIAKAMPLPARPSRMPPSTALPLPLMEQALSQLNDVVLITEAEPLSLPGPRIVYVNEAFERMSGYTAAEVLGRTPRILQGPRTARTELDRLNAALGRWEPCRVALTNYRKDGRPFDVEFEVVPVANEHGWYTHWVSMQRDTTLQTVAATIIARAESVEELVTGVLRETVEYADVDGACWETRALGSDAWRATHTVMRDRASSGAAARYVEGRHGVPQDAGARDVIVAIIPLRDGSGARMVLWRNGLGDTAHVTELANAVVERCTISYERLRADAARELLEARLRQAQKLESIGRLAGGVAHDFNNLLTVIVGNLELLKDRVPPDDGGHDEVEEVLRATDRARSLVQHLLTFSRQQPITLGALDLASVIRETVVLLQRALGSHITLAVDIPASLPMATGDAALLEQVLINLAVNSRDAIQSARAEPGILAIGHISIRVTELVLCEDDRGDWAQLVPGQYLCLSVADDGPGMPPEVLERAFDPFFTTKPVGSGTGLGLSSVYGAVNQMGGDVHIGNGAASGVLVRIMLPVRVPAA